MKMLSLNFSIYTVCGIWRPPNWSSTVANSLYNLFTIFVMFCVYTFTFTQFLDILLVVDNIDDFTTNSFMFPAMISVCCKATSVIVHREKIIGLINSLQREPCKPRDEEEEKIQSSFDQFIRSCSIKYTILAAAAAITASMKSAVSVMNSELPYRAWLPYNSTVVFSFWCTSIQQMLTILIGTAMNVGTETLIFGLMVQTCSQLEILRHRFNSMTRARNISEKSSLQNISISDTRKQLSMCIYHHLNIFKYAQRVNKTFNTVLFVQFFSSIIVLCSSIFYLSTCQIQSVAFITLAVYSTCMLVQTFIYCWSGNEVMLKSMSIGNAIYETNWTLMDVNERKSLLIVMKRCTMPIKFTSSFLVTLTLDSYTSILKASYSAFNLLQQS